ncbi:MAG: HAMP domain-containing protein [Balneolales bacterium]|nr:HAMP domain-containing protein [Balneolales bacterium]
MNWLWVALGLLFLAWLAGEAHFYFGKPGIEEREQLTRQALDGAVNTFKRVEQDLIEQTQRLKSSILPILDEDADAQRVYRRLQGEKNFRGITIFQNGQPFAWSGNPVTYLTSLNENEINVTMQQSGYVIYFICQISFRQDDGTRYDIVTTRLVRRTGASPNLLTQQYDATAGWAKEQIYPVHYRFFDIDMAPVATRQVPLFTVSQDSVGFVTVSAADFTALEREWHKNMVWFRWTLVNTSLLWFLAFGLLVTGSLQKGDRYISSAILTIGMWQLLKYLDLPSSRLFPDTASFNLLQISSLFTDAIFVMLAANFAVRYLFRLERTLKHRPAKPHNAVLISLFLASASAFLSIWSVERIVTAISHTETGLLSLQVLPQLNTLFIYLSTLFLFGSFLAVLFNSIKIVSRKEFHKYNTVSFILFFFITAILWYYLLARNADPYFFGIPAVILFAIMLVFFGRSFQEMAANAHAKPRIITFGVFFVMLLSLPVFFSSEISRENETMKRMAINFATTDDQQARIITEILIQDLLQEGILSQVQAIEATPSFPLQSAVQFRTQMSRLIKPEWSAYTVMGFLLDGRLNIIADYGSQTSFTDRFSTSFHDEVRSFIRQSLQRPFARLPIIESETRFSGFPIFVKGLQSIPSDFPTQPSWLVTFIVVEGTSFGRPVNDALAFHRRDRESWNRYVISEFRNGDRVRSTETSRSPMLAQTHQLASHLRITPEDGNKIIRISDRTPYRKLIVPIQEDHHVTVTVRDLTFLNYIFSGFRFFVAMLIICLIVYQTGLFFTYGSLKIGNRHNERRRLQDRILDSYLIATLLFLIALAFVTEQIVARQNVRITEQELYKNLNALERLLSESDPLTSRQQLARLDDLDVMIFEDNQITTTTAPEIFRLQLISDFLPFEAYQRIHSDQKSTVFQPVNLGDMTILMGFRSIFEDGKITRILGIPAYTRSAVYEEEFLQTTTYLIGFYIIIFVFFSGLAWALARNLAQPLSALEEGLKQISSGNMNTVIEATTNDEIGELANVYNQMVVDLKNLRTELSKAERDAAWSEMARQIAHEIKNPLTPMKLSIQHLQRQMYAGRSMEELKPAIERLTDMLVDQIESLNAIASDFSAFAKPLTGNRTKLDLNELVRSSAALFESQPMVKIQLGLYHSPALITGSEDELKRVFINIIKNGIEAMPEGGVLSLSVQQIHRVFHISITDTGVGVEPEIQDKIFMPNFSTKTSGTGLGLAICKKIIDAHGGEIRFTSSYKSGSQFEVLLPALENVKMTQD